jgi:hypothetical protein
MYSQLIGWFVDLFNSVFSFAPPDIRGPVALAIFAAVLYTIGYEVRDEEKSIFATISVGWKETSSKLISATIFITMWGGRIILSGSEFLIGFLATLFRKLRAKANELVEIEEAPIKIDSLIVIRGVEIKLWHFVALLLAITGGGSLLTGLDLFPLL